MWYKKKIIKFTFILSKFKPFYCEINVKIVKITEFMNIPHTFARNASNRTPLHDGTPRKRNGLTFLRNKNKRHYVWVQNIGQKPQFSCDICSENVPTGGRKCVPARCSCIRPECRGGWSDFVQRKSIHAKGVEIRRRLTGGGWWFQKRMDLVNEFEIIIVSA